MPLPIAIGWGVVALAGVYGAKKGYDGYQDSKEAKRTNLEAKNLYDKAFSSLKVEKDNTQESLEKLGNLKLNFYKELIIPTIDMLNKIPELPTKKEFIFNGKTIKLPNQNDHLEMKKYETSISDIISGGAKALGTGGLVGLATFGGVGTFAATTTGTTIASLSGAVATNATFAWLGGGSLASGGLGIAGGTAILGGIIAAPVLAVAGMIVASKAEEAKNIAYSNLDLAKTAVEELKLAEVRTNGIKRLSDEVIMTLESIEKYYLKNLNNLQDVIYKKGVPQKISKRSIETLFKKKEYLSWDINDLEKIAILYSFYETTVNILEVDLLKDNGNVNPEVKNKLDLANELSK
mgnify:CR=1 FL=1